MIKMSDKVLLEFCEKLSIQRESVVFLGGGREDSDGVVYTYEKSNKKRVLKILALPVKEQENLNRLRLRVQYANFLGEHGIRLAYPLKNEDGNLYETVIYEDYCFVAYIMEFSEGVNPKSEELNDALVKEWGKLTAKSHKLTKEFTKNLAEIPFGYQNELDYFYNWCKDKTVKEAWTAMSDTLSVLPTSTEDYGFIHNDNHQNNILVSKDGITLIDFDCAGPQFYVQDIITPAQGIMFDITGGMLSPIRDSIRLNQFFESFLSGYEQEGHLTDLWYGKLNTFLNYRRLLLYTCMEDWLNTQPELKNGFIQMILNPPKVF